MTKKHVVHTAEAAPPAGHYSQAVVAGDFVYLCGATPHRSDGSKVEGSFAEQAHATFGNLAAIAKAAGSDLASAVQARVYLRDLGNFREMNDVSRGYFGEEPPARTTIQADLPGFDIEIDCVLYRPAG